MTTAALSKPPTPTSDNELVALALQGNGNAFEAIMRKHNQLMFRTARSILKNDADAEDAVQEAYLSAWRSLKTYRAESKLSTWLVRIVSNEALGRIRQTKTGSISLEDAMTSLDENIHDKLTDKPENAPESTLNRQQIRRLLESHIDALPDQYRTVFMLRAVEDMDIDEVANILDIPEATVRTRFFRAKNMLHENLASDVDHLMGDVFAFDGERCDRIVRNTLAKARDEGLLRA